MGATMFMKVPNISGDATEKNHNQWIKVTQLDFGVSRQISADPGHVANRESTRPAISEITIEKNLDSASSLLFGEACTGTAKSQVIIECCKTGTQGMTTIAQFTLENAIISGYKVSSVTPAAIATTAPGATANNAAAAMKERLTISFDKVEMKTTPYSTDGAQLTPISYAYDMKTAAAA
jgi:type VI secretion system secreted protein Hcp